MQQPLKHALWCLCVAALFVAGCKVDNSPNVAYRCVGDTDCLSDERCLEGICRNAASLQQGRPNRFTCDPTCSQDRQLCCEKGCTDPATDLENCGACGKVCESGDACIGGHCVPEVCDNGLDDNKDGKTDCQDDVMCPKQTACRGGLCCQGKCVSESTAALCANGVDDDCDNKKDCEDEKCLGQVCGTGKVCAADKSCAAGCFIGGTFYADGAPNPQSPCYVCKASSKLYEWTAATARATTDTCKDGLQCDGGGRCRRANGQVCAGPSDCVSAKCSATGVCTP